MLDKKQETETRRERFKSHKMQVRESQPHTKWTFDAIGEEKMLYYLM